MYKGSDWFHTTPTYKRQIFMFSSVKHYYKLIESTRKKLLLVVRSVLEKVLRCAKARIGNVPS